MSRIVVVSACELRLYISCFINYTHKLTKSAVFNTKRYQNCLLLPRFASRQTCFFKCSKYFGRAMTSILRGCSETNEEVSKYFLKILLYNKVLGNFESLWEKHNYLCTFLISLPSYPWLFSFKMSTAKLVIFFLSGEIS